MTQDAGLTLCVSAFAILLLSSTTLVGAFQVPSTSSSTTAAATTVRDLAHLHHHDFWRKERTHDEVRSHIYSCLASVDEVYGTTSEAASSDTTVLQPEVRVVSAEPPLVIVHDFITKEMCHDIIEAAKERNLKPSTLGAAQKSSDTRTSSTVWLNDKSCTSPSRLIAEKVSWISGLPPSHQENLQVVRYEPGQQFKLHTDHLDSFNDLDVRGRLATCLVYLEEPDAGGETWFPGVNEFGDDNSIASNRNSNDEEGDVAISPKKGSAIFFWNTVEKPGCEGYEPDMFLNVVSFSNLFHA